MRAPIRLGLAALVLSLSGCPADSPGDGGGSESEGDSEMGTTIAMTTAAMTMTTADDTTSAGDDDDDDDDDDDATGDTTSGTTAATGDDDDDDATGDTSGTSTGGGAVAYPPCDPMADPQCPEPYEQCYPFIEGFTVCTAPCMFDADCPAVPSGDAQAVCAGVDGDECLLDCQNGRTCPDGMSCESINAGGTDFFRCVWAIE